MKTNTDIILIAITGGLGVALTLLLMAKKPPPKPPPTPPLPKEKSLTPYERHIYNNKIQQEAIDRQSADCPLGQVHDMYLNGCVYDTGYNPLFTGFLGSLRNYVNVKENTFFKPQQGYFYK